MNRDNLNLDIKPSSKVYCEYCGVLARKDSIFHHENHVILRTKRYDSRTGEKLKHPKLSLGRGLGWKSFSREGQS
jgi:hypothetical protein